MKRALLRLRNLTLCNRNYLLNPPKFNTNPSPSLSFPPVFAWIDFRARSYSSESESTRETHFAQTQNRTGFPDGGDYISKEDLKKLIEKFYKGDKEALPSIFEAILKRKLAGINDDDLMQELRDKGPTIDLNINGKEESDSDFDDLSETDEDADDWNNVKEVDYDSDLDKL